MSNGRPSPKWLVGSLPVFGLLVLYLYLAEGRHALNPNDPLLPLPRQLAEELWWLLTVNSSGWGPQLWVDTAASLSRLAVGLSGAGLLGLILALSMRLSEKVDWALRPLVVVLAKIPPFAILPILLLWLGAGEGSKLALLLLGLAPLLTLHLDLELSRNEKRFSDKLASLALPTWQRVGLIHLPMLWPAFLREIQTLLGTAWLFILAAENFGAKWGLGYRIFVVRRHLAMDVILIYAVWITLLSLLLYILIGRWIRRYGWHHAPH